MITDVLAVGLFWFELKVDDEITLLVIGEARLLLLAPPNDELFWLMSYSWWWCGWAFWRFWPNMTPPLLLL